MAIGPEYVTAEDFRWSLGLIIGALVTSLVAIFGRLWVSISRKEVATALAEVRKAYSEQLEQIEEKVEMRHEETKDSLRHIREDNTYIRTRLDGMFGVRQGRP